MAEPREFEAVEVAEAHDRLLPASDSDPELPRRFARPRASLGAFAALLLAAAALVVFAAGRRAPRLRGEPQAFLLGESQELCGEAETGVDYKTGSRLFELGNVPSAEKCLRACDRNEQCRVWTWDEANRCSLKALGPREEPKKQRQRGMVSGRKCSVTEDMPRVKEDEEDEGEGEERSATVVKEAGAHYSNSTSCGYAEEGVDYWTKLPLYQLGDIESPEACCKVCQEELPCTAWTWGKSDSEPGLANVCFLKGFVKAMERVTKHPNSKVISGRSCRTMDNKAMQCGEEPKPSIDCNEHREGRDLWTEKSLTQVNAIETVKDCQRTCQRTLGCGAYTWGKADAEPGLALVCFLKGLRLGERPSEHANRHVISGVLCDFRPFSRRHANGSNSSEGNSSSEGRNGSGAGNATTAAPTSSTLTTVTTSTTTGTGTSTTGTSTTATNTTSTRTSSATTGTRTTSTSHEPYHPNSLYCFALMQPHGYERELIADQYRDSVSLFDCDEAAIFSSAVIEVAPGLRTAKVESDLKCEKGGEFMTALNTEIFFAVWDEVIKEGRYNLHSWTVKVDPDCVFLPARLRLDLRHHFEGPTGAYINNCRHGLHGPLEVFSRIAVMRWAQGREGCVEHFTKLCAGPCLWGEDMFIDQCLSKVLGVRRDDDWSLLQEDHCDPPKGWDSCEDITKAAFHPFKKKEEWRRCLKNAGGY